MFFYPDFFILCARNGKFDLCVGGVKEVIGPTFQMRKLNSRKRKCVLQGHTDSRKVKWGLKHSFWVQTQHLCQDLKRTREVPCIEVPTGGSQTPDPEFPCIQGACVHVRCFPRDNLTIPHGRQTLICGLPSPEVVGVGKLWINNTIRVWGHLSCAFPGLLGLHYS